MVKNLLYRFFTIMLPNTSSNQGWGDDYHFVQDQAKLTIAVLQC
jgi:hypothetical protein